MKKLKRRRRRVRVGPGFVWREPEGRHAFLCADSTDAGNLAPVAGGDVHLGLVDPPYAVSSERVIKLEGRKDLSLDPAWDLFEDEGSFWTELEAIVVSTRDAFDPGNLWVWTSDWWLSPLKRLVRRLGYRVGPSYHWCKPNPMPSVRKRNPASAVEYLVMGFGKDAFFDLAALPKQRNYHVAHPDGSFGPAVSPYWVERAVVSQAERLKRGKTREDVNPTQKPIDLVEALVRAGAPEGGLVVDTCGGTGTTTAAAEAAARRSIYVDRDPYQVRESAKRLLRERRAR